MSLPPTPPLDPCMTYLFFNILHTKPSNEQLKC